MHENLWGVKGGTLSDKTAKKEFGLTDENIIRGIQEGKLQFRENHIHGNPYFRLLRNEVESLVNEIHGEKYLKNKNVMKELNEIKKELRAIAKRQKSLEERRDELTKMLH